MRQFFISDIHGQDAVFGQLLAYAKFQPGVDQLVIGGDMINRGPESALVLKRVKALCEEYPDRVTALAGNHEHMMMMLVNQQNDMWLQHGGSETIQAMNDLFTPEESREHVEWVASLPILHADKEYVYVHAGLIPGIPLYEQNPFEVMWMPYSTSQYLFSRDFTNQEILLCTNNRKVVSGHIPKSYVFDDGARIACDLGASVKPKEAKLALVDLTNDRYTAYHFDTGEIKERKIARKKPAHA